MPAATADRPAVRSRAAFGALRHRDFRLYWLGACLSFVGSWVQMVAMGLLVYQLTQSARALGIIGLVGGLPTTFLMLFGGVIADRSNKRALVLVTQTIFALSAFALSALTWTHTIRIWQIVLISCINGIVFAVDGPARQAMISDLVGREDLASGVALQSVAFNTARVIGPAVGGIIYAAMGAGWCFFINGVSFGAIIIAVLMIRTDLTQKADTGISVWGGFTEGVRYMRSMPLMRSVLGLTAVTSIFAFATYSTLMPAYAQEVLHIPDRDQRYGLLFSAIGLGSLSGAYLVGRFSAAGRRGFLMILGANVFALMLMALAHASVIWIAMVIFVMIGLSAISQLATANTLTQMLAPEELRGRAVSAHMFAMALQPFGAFIAGSIAQRWGVPMALMVGAGVFWIYTLGLLVFKPSIARLD